jgi:hypothetical protein
MNGRLLTVLVVAAAGFGAAGVAPAQAYGAYDDYYGSRPVTFQIGAGYSAPTGPIYNYLQGGYVFSGGFTFAPNASRLGLRGDLVYSGHDATNNFLAYGTAVTGVQVDSGTGQFFSFTLGPQYKVPFIGRSRAYAFAQVGGVYSSLRLTQTALFQGTFCDPFLGFCNFGVFPGDVLVYDDTRTRLGYDAGLGIEFPTWFGTTYFIEASYHRIAGSQSIAYVPIEIGLRF